MANEQESPKDLAKRLLRIATEQSNTVPTPKGGTNKIWDLAEEAFDAVKGYIESPKLFRDSAIREGAERARRNNRNRSNS